MSARTADRTFVDVHLRGIRHHFGRLAAIDGVDLHVRPGEIHAVLGENGAGKTTLMRVMSGYLQPDEGEVVVDGRPTSLPDPAAALHHGIGMVHQHSVLVPELTVAENIMLGRQPSWLARFSRRELEREVDRLCRGYGLDLDPGTCLSGLSADLVQQVEIVRLLHRRVGTLVLDEPTAILGRAYVDRLFEVLSDLRDRGHAIVIITHKLREVLALADRVTVMRTGQVTATLRRDEFDEESLTQALVGRAIPDITRPPRARTYDEEPALVVDRLAVRGDRGEPAVDQFSLTVDAGEILGVAGVEGNGQRELVEALTGLRPYQAGTVEFGGDRRTRWTPAELDRAGVAVVSEDRLRWDVVPALSLAENLMLSRVAAGDPAVTRFGFLRKREIARLTAEQLDGFDVRPGDPELPVSALSGGNQQKLVLARETEARPRVMIAAHPTRGLDIAATNAVHERLLALRARGSAILMVSADLDELLVLADRILVMYRGQDAYTCSADEAPADRIGRAMIGAAT